MSNLLIVPQANPSAIEYYQYDISDVQIADCIARDCQFQQIFDSCSFSFSRQCMKEGGV